MKSPQLTRAGWIVLAVVVLGGLCTRMFPREVRYLGRDGVFFQRAANDCGAAALKMVFDRLGIDMDYATLARRLNIGVTGAAMLSMRDLAVSQGLLCAGWRLAPQDLAKVPLPAVLRLHRNHFVVVEALESEREVAILDPARGRLRMSISRLITTWNGEALVFNKPGAVSNQHGRWFERSHFTEGKETR